MEPTILFDAAAIGGAIATLIQAIKLLPASWLKVLLGKKKEEQSNRIQAMVFVITILATLYQAYLQNLFHAEHIFELLASFFLSLSTAYTTYQAVLKGLAKKFPSVFNV